MEDKQGFHRLVVDYYTFDCLPKKAEMTQETGRPSSCNTKMEKTHLSTSVDGNGTALGHAVFLRAVREPWGSFGGESQWGRRSDSLYLSTQSWQRAWSGMHRK